METLGKPPVQLEINHSWAGTTAGGGLRSGGIGLHSTVCAPVTRTEPDPQTFFSGGKKKCQAYFLRFNFLSVSWRNLPKAQAASTRVSSITLDFEIDTQCDFAKVNKNQGRRKIKKSLGLGEAEPPLRRWKKRLVGVGERAEFWEFQIQGKGCQIQQIKKPRSIKNWMPSSIGIADEHWIIF